MSGTESETARTLARLGPDRLLVNEIYYSLQGESTYAGRPCVFVRLAGCHLRCTYCDSSHAHEHGTQRSVAQVVDAVLACDCPLVEVTGGEPLLQEGTHELLRTCADRGLTVLLETNGAMDLARVDPRVVKIVDLKCPSSGECDPAHLGNIQHLTDRDEAKFVIGTRDDYEWARTVVVDHDLASRCTVLVGVVFGRLDPRRLVEWVLDDHLPVRLQLQMHKYIWPPDKRGV